MKRKVDVEQLRVGMYVTDLDRPWLETPFLFQGFEICDETDIHKLRQFCKQVYILAPEESGAKTPVRTVRQTPAMLSDNQPHTHLRDNIEIEQAMLKITNRPGDLPIYDDLTSLEEEIGLVSEAYTQAKRLVYSTVAHLRAGRSLKAEDVKHIVGELTESVIRNPDALACFTQLRKRDEYTAMHGLRVCILALILGRHLGFDREQLNALGIGALLHDVGKIAIPDAILKKEGPLDPQEFKIMQSHVPKGVALLKSTPGIPSAAIDFVRCHHERYDGSGYMNGLKGEGIGTLGLIGGIVDCYDAITSDRPYRNGMSPHTALKSMYEWRSKDFHPELLENFIQCMGIYPIGSVVELNTGEVGVVVTLNRLRRLKPRVVLVRQSDHRPYEKRPAVNLVYRKTADGRPCEIERVLEPAQCGIDPATHLPIQKLA